MLPSSTFRPPVRLKPFQEQARSGRARRRHLHGDEVHGGEEEEEMGPKILSIGMILLNVTSRGFAHIQVGNWAQKGREERAEGTQERGGEGRRGWGLLLHLVCPELGVMKSTEHSMCLRVLYDAGGHRAPTRCTCRW